MRSHVIWTKDVGRMRWSSPYEGHSMENEEFPNNCPDLCVHELTLLTS